MQVIHQMLATFREEASDSICRVLILTVLNSSSSMFLFFLFPNASRVQILTPVELCYNKIAIAWKCYDNQSFNKPGRRDRRAET